MASKLKGLGTTALFTILFSLQSAWAAERVLLNYRGFSRSIAVQDLAILAESGETSDRLASLLDMAGQRPEELRSLLTHSIETNPRILDRALNSYPRRMGAGSAGGSHPSARWPGQSPGAALSYRSIRYR